MMVCSSTKEKTFISSGFDELILYDPARVDKMHSCSALKIVTAFTDCDRISTHMIKLSEGMKKGVFVKGLKVDIVLGMTKSSLSQKKHEDICRLIRFLNGSKEMPCVSCRYICNGSEVHSKLYIWAQSHENILLPKYAYCGSLNYTMNAFYRRREIVSQCDSNEALQYYNSVLSDTIDCFDENVAERLKNIVNNTFENEADEPDNSELEYAKYDKATPEGILRVSLLRANQTDTGYGSGINWGIRRNGTRRDRNQAYIPYNTADKRIGFFPDRSTPDEENCPMFKVITKDFGSFHMRMAQQGNKALHSVESNAILGEWIRKRLGEPSGAYITKQMLENYGKTYVEFRKYADGTYLLDF